MGVAEIQATDVKIAEDGTPALVVIARGVERFQITRVRQKEPYFVVDTVPLVEVVEDGQFVTEYVTKGKILNVLNGELEREAKFGTDNTSKKRNVETEAHNLGVLALSSMIMRHEPKAAQNLLASTSAVQRQAQVERWIHACKSDSPISGQETLLIFATIIVRHFIPSLLLFSALTFWHAS